jgi:Bacterial Ig domain
MADPCVRSITFTIPSTSAGPATQVYVEELSGNLVFTVDLLDTAALTGDLRGLFFHMTEAALAGLSVVNADAAVTETRIARNSVIDLGNGANLQGAVKSGFDVGIEFGEAGIGIGKLDVNGPVSFTLDGTQNLTLDLLTHMQYGSRITSIGAPAGSRSGSSKDLVVAPAAPDAQADSYQIFEDGQSGLNDPSATPDGVLFAVLANDTDADGDTLTVTDVHGAAHGTLQIVDGPDADLLPGDAVLYTPDKDYAGGDSFEYCVSDGHGGTDFASVDVLVVTVADVPTL